MGLFSGIKEKVEGVDKKYISKEDKFKVIPQADFSEDEKDEIKQRKQIQKKKLSRDEIKLNLLELVEQI